MTDGPVRVPHPRALIDTGAHPFRFRQGDFEVTVLSDGFISVPAEIVTAGAMSGERESLMPRLDAADGMVFSKCNVPVIRRADEVILIDSGSGDRYQPSDGRLPAHLAAAGIHPEDITRIVFTHAHPDHIGATVLHDERLRFPNATYYVGATEWSFWTDPDYMTNMPDLLHEFARGAQRDLGAVKDRVVLLQPGDDVVAGLTALDTAGHTPGHLSLVLSGAEGLIITADATTNEVVSFEHPDWPFGYDTAPDLAIRSRARLLDQAATDHVKMLGYHWAYPGIGFAERIGRAYRFVSVGG